MHDVLQRVEQAAERFSELHGQHSLQNWPQGVEGLREFSDTLERCCSEIDSEELEEDGVIEGGGALFALLLVAALPDASLQALAGNVSLRLGRFGCIDPFEAIRSVLDDDFPSEALRREVARAEEEAHGNGAIARVVSTLAEQIERETQHKLTKTDGRTAVFTDGLEISLAPLLRVCDGESIDDVQSAVGRLVRSIPGDHQRASDQQARWEDQCARLFPRVVSETFALQMNPRGLHIEPFGQDLRLGFVVRESKMVRYLLANEIPDSFRSKLRDQATLNLERISKRVRVRPYRNDPRAMNLCHDGVFQLTYGDGFDASRMSLPGLPSALEDRFGAGFFASVPHRDALLVSGAEHRRHLAAATQDAFSRAPHALSNHVFRFETDSWRQLGEAGR